MGTWWAFLGFLGVAARFHLPWAQPTTPSTVRDAAEILHLNVDQYAKVIMLVTADQFTDDPTADREPDQSTGSQDPADRGRVFTVGL